MRCWGKQCCQPGSSDPNRNARRRAPDLTQASTSVAEVIQDDARHLLRMRDGRHMPSARDRDVPAPWHRSRQQLRRPAIRRGGFGAADHGGRHGDPAAITEARRVREVGPQRLGAGGCLRGEAGLGLLAKGGPCARPIPVPVVEKARPGRAAVARLGVPESPSTKFMSEPSALPSA
jgi:hypothetical protein